MTLLYPTQPKEAYPSHGRSKSMILVTLKELSNNSNFPVCELLIAHDVIIDFLGAPSMAWLCEALKTVLYRNNIPFIVAPFKAHAQVSS